MKERHGKYKDNLAFDAAWRDGEERVHGIDGDDDTDVICLWHPRRCLLDAQFRLGLGVCPLSFFLSFLLPLQCTYTILQRTLHGGHIHPHIHPNSAGARQFRLTRESSAHAHKSWHTHAHTCIYTRTQRACVSFMARLVSLILRYDK